MVPLFIVLFLAGLAVGYLLAAWQQKRQPPVENGEYEQLKRENAEFKAKVNQHFDQSSEMFQTITEQYVKLYNHMSHSATDLYDDKNAQSPKLDTIEVKRVTAAEDKKAHSDTTDV